MSFFRAIASATQSIVSNTELELTFGTELSDPDNVFASNRFTVPAGWNGRVGSLTAGIRVTSGATDILLRIQKQTGGSGSFLTIAENGQGALSIQGVTLTAQPLIFATGDVYRVTVFGSGNTKAAEARTFFSGWVAPSATKLGMCRARKTTNQNVSVSTLVNISFDTEEVDSHSIFASDVITVPSDFDGGFLDINACVNFGNTGAWNIYIARSTDGGANYTLVSQDAMYQTNGDIRTSLGPIAAVTGHKYRVSVFSSLGNGDLQPGLDSYLGAVLFKY